MNIQVFEYAKMVIYLKREAHYFLYIPDRGYFFGQFYYLRMGSLLIGNFQINYQVEQEMVTKWKLDKGAKIPVNDCNSRADFIVQETYCVIHLRH